MYEFGDDVFPILLRIKKKIILRNCSVRVIRFCTLLRGLLVTSSPIMLDFNGARSTFESEPRHSSEDSFKKQSLRREDANATK